MFIQEFILNPSFWLIFSLLFLLPFLFLGLNFIIKSFYWFNIWILLFFLCVLIVSNIKTWVDLSIFPFDITIFSLFLPLIIMLFFNLDSRINFDYKKNIFYSIPLWFFLFIYIVSFYFTVFRNAFFFDISDLILNFFNTANLWNFNFMIKFWDKSNTIFTLGFIFFLYNLLFMNIILKIFSFFSMIFLRLNFKNKKEKEIPTETQESFEEDLHLN